MAPLRDRLYSIQPSGNALMRGAAPDIRAGLGALAPLPDDVLLAVLALLPPRDLARAGAASRALLALVDGGADLWRAHVLQDIVEGQAPAEGSGGKRRPRLRWRGGWRETYAASVVAEDEGEEEVLRPSKRPRSAATPTPPTPQPPPPSSSSVPVLYSDLLHASRRCASLPRLPRRWLERETVDRVDASQLTRQAFVARYERPNLPVIVTGVVDKWPAYSGEGGKDKKTAAAASPDAPWTSLQALLERTPLGRSGAPVVVGNQAWDLKEYVSYARQNDDEMPLYLFDKRFVDKAPRMAEHYSAPTQIFGDDLFSLLPPSSRPDWRWLIAGPARSGSTFHVDPNATSAWNAVVSGAKRWVLFPPGGLPPPGVHPSPDGAEVAAPVSILEWYWAFYEAAREEEEEEGGGEEAKEESDTEEDEDEEEEDEAGAAAAGAPPPTRLASRSQLERAGQKPPQKARHMFECTVRAGELLFVPRGWWHMALNLEEGVAVTHNFVSEETLPHVLRFLRTAAAAAKAEEEQEEAEAASNKEKEGEPQQNPGSSKRHASLAQDLVSGLDLSERGRLYDRFVAALRESEPRALERALARLDEEDAAAEGRRRLAAAFQSAGAVAAGGGGGGGDGDGAEGAAANGNGNGGGNGSGGGNAAGGFSFSFF